MLRATPAMNACAFSARPSKTRTKSRSVSWIFAASGSVSLRQRLKRLHPVGDVFQRHRLQLGAPLQRLHEKRQRRFDSFAALRKPIQERAR